MNASAQEDERGKSMSGRRILLLALAAAATLWLYGSTSLRRSATASHFASTFAASHLEVSGVAPSEQLLMSIFDRADGDGDGKLSRGDFLAAARGSVSASQTASAGAAANAASPMSGYRRQASAELPQCSILFFFHIVKTAGTTMRTVLQRQAQLGDFEYIYTDTTRKPRWQLIMHQLSHKVAARRVIIEMHSEWGLPRAFFADVRRIRRLYEPLGCRVTLGTMLRHPFTFYLSWFNWRASNYMPLCMWDPPRDPQSRQLLGWGLPFVQATLEDSRGGRRMAIPPESAISVLDHFDVVGLTEHFDESLLALGTASGMRHLGYARLAANNKPEHPKLAKKILEAVLRDLGVPSTKVAVGAENRRPGFFRRRRLNSSSEAGAKVDGMDMEGDRAWSPEAVEAIQRLDQESLRFSLKLQGYGRKPQPTKTDCNFYPCMMSLKQADGVLRSDLCAGISGEELLYRLLEKTSTDRALHAHALARLDRTLSELGSGRLILGGGKSSILGKSGGRSSTGGGGGGGGGAGPLVVDPLIVSRGLAQIKAASADVERRRVEAVGEHKEKLCGVNLCGNPLRSCVGCEPNPVPGMEPCWPSWEDQFSPDEQQFYCRRSMTFPGYDEAEIKARLYPSVSPIPCWQTCWETMRPNASAPHGRSPSCLLKDAPPPGPGGVPGPSCAGREVQCTPSCGTPLAGALREFWADWEKGQADEVPNLAIGCPCGPGG
jgi:hypothetical protein